MNHFNAVLFAVRQLEIAAQANENDETLTSMNILHDASQRFRGAADLASEHSDVAVTVLFRALEITLHNIAHDSTTWHILPELYSVLRLEANNIGADKAPF